MKNYFLLITIDQMIYFLTLDLTIVVVAAIDEFVSLFAFLALYSVFWGASA
jgi:hypothetical protein